MSDNELLQQVRALLWDEHPECCGKPVVGAEYMGDREMVCCGCPNPTLLNDAQIVASLRALFPLIESRPETQPIALTDEQIDSIALDFSESPIQKWWADAINEALAEGTVLRKFARVAIAKATGEAKQ